MVPLQTVLDLWENQRGGVSNVFWTYFDYFFEGCQYKLGGFKGTRGGGGVNLPTNRALITIIISIISNYDYYQFTFSQEKLA